MLIEGPDREEIFRRLFPDYPNEAQISRFLQALGRSITVWQLVETALYEVYEVAIGPQRPGAAASGFHAIQTFQIKLKATNAAIRFLFYDNSGLDEEWQKLYQSADKKSQRRNQLVHFSTYIMSREKRENDKIRLEPQLHDYRHPPGDVPKFRVTDIIAFGTRFDALAKELMAFKSKLSAALGERQHTASP